MVGETIYVPPQTDYREFSSVLGSSTLLANPAVLTHRPGELSLDNAFALIERHRANADKEKPAAGYGPISNTVPEL